MPTEEKTCWQKSLTDQFDYALAVDPDILSEPAITSHVKNEGYLILTPGLSLQGSQEQKSTWNENPFSSFAGIWQK